MPQSLKLNQNHILFEAQSNILEICKPLYNYLRIEYFHYRRTFHDGSYFILSTNSEWPLYFIANNVPVKTPVAKQFFDSQSYFSLWHGNVPDETLSAARNYYGIKSAIALVERNNIYFDSYSFGSENDETTYDKYINNIDSFLKFIEFFHVKAHALIKNANKQRITPPDSLKDINLDKIMHLNAFDQKEKFMKDIMPIKAIYKTISGFVELTKREAECMFYLSHGRNRQEVGTELGLSPRTVDTHLEKAKNKLGCLTTSGLVDIFWSNHR